MDGAGGDLDEKSVHDPEKVAKHFKKNNWEAPEGPPGYDYSKGGGNPKNFTNDGKDDVGSF